MTECLFLLKGVLLKPRDVLSSLLYTIIIYIGIIKEITQKLTIFMRKFLRKICNQLIFSVVCGDSRSRTDDPLLAKQML